MPRRFAGLAALPLLVVGSAAVAGAQQVRGLGDDAILLPRGVFRAQGGGRWNSFYDQYDSTGALHGMGDRFTLDTLGVAQFPALAPVQTAIRTLAGNSAVNVTLGKTAVSASGRIQTTTFGVDAGIFRWLQLGVRVPIVQTRSNVFLHVNPSGTGGNLALNPEQGNSSAFTQETAFATQLLQSAAAVQSYCSRSPTPPQCTNGATLATAAQAFGNAVKQVYTDTSAFLPAHESALQTTIDTRAASLRNQLNAFAAISGSGVPQVTQAWTATNITTPATTPQVQALLVDSAFGIGIDSLRTTESVSLGDIEVAAKIALLDPFGGDLQRSMHPTGFHARAALGVAFRFPTGRLASPTIPLGIETGTHEGGIGVRGYLDLLRGEHFWTSIVTRYTKSLGTEAMVRVPMVPDQPFVPLYATTQVHQTLGNVIEIEATPRWVVNEFLSISGQYVYRHQAQSTVTGAPFTVGASAVTGGTTVTIDPATLVQGTAFSEHRIGWGVSLSDLFAFSQGRTGFPLDVTYLHFQTIKGNDVPKTFSDQIQLRWYTPRLFGRG